MKPSLDFLKVVNKGGASTPARIDVRGPIDMKWDSENYSVTDTEREVLKLLAAIPADQETHVHVTSEGGSVKMALGIHNAFKPRAAKLTFHNAGVMFSSATILAPKGSKVITPKASLYGIHNPALSNSGPMTAEQLQSAANSLSAVGDVIAGIYAERTGKSMESCKGMMKRTTLMGGQQAVDEGFADETGDEEPDEDDVVNNALAAQVTMRFADIPKQLRARLEATSKISNSFSDDECIAACRVCLAACQSCFDECSACQDTSTSLHQACIQECEDCIQKCKACISDLSRGGNQDSSLAICRSCAESCEECRTACMECASSCDHCAPYCNTCAEECAEASLCCNDSGGPQNHLHFRARIDARAIGGKPNGGPPRQSDTKTQMKALITALAAKGLVLPENATEEQIVAAYVALQSDNQNHKAAQKVRVENRVQAAIDGKKIKAERKAWFVAQGMTDETALDVLDEIQAPQAPAAPAPAPVPSPARRGAPPAPPVPAAGTDSESQINAILDDINAVRCKKDLRPEAVAAEIGTLTAKLKALRGDKPAAVTYNQVR